MASTILARFWAKVDLIPFTTCWIWTGSGTIGRRGEYGLFSSGRGNVLAHRFSWELHNAKEIPYRMSVMHSCDNPSCVNPDHLSIGTHDENMKDMKRKGRARGVPGARNRHAKLSTEDVAYIRDERMQGITCMALAEMFGVKHSTISRISRGDGWR